MTWYSIRHALIWICGILGVGFGIAVLFDVPMWVVGSLDPALMIADICTAGFFGMVAYGLYDAQREDDYAPVDRTKES